MHQISFYYNLLVARAHLLFAAIFLTQRLIFIAG